MTNDRYKYTIKAEDNGQLYSVIRHSGTGIGAIQTIYKKSIPLWHAEATLKLLGCRH